MESQNNDCRMSAGHMIAVGKHALGQHIHGLRSHFIRVSGLLLCFIFHSVLTLSTLAVKQLVFPIECV